MVDADRRPGIPDELRTLVASVVPGARFDDAQVIGEGWNATAWRVPSADGDQVLRIPKLDEARGEMERQSCLGPKLHELGLPVPMEWELLRDARGRVVGGLYRYTEGTLSDARGARERRVLALQVARFLSTLHEVDVSIALGCGARELADPWHEVYEPMIARRASVLPRRSAAWVRLVGERLASSSRELPGAVLVHADLKPEHLVVDEEGALRAVLDFEGPLIGDPALDFARLIQYWGAGFTRVVYGAYRGALDEALAVRARCYFDLEVLRTVDVALERGGEWLRWASWGQRRIAARAAAATRGGTLAR